SSFLEDATGQGLAFFDFLPLGVTASLAAVAAMFCTTGLLPRHRREDVSIAEYLVEARVTEGSELIGRSIAANGLRELESLFLVEVVRGDHLISPVSPAEYIEEGDKLIFSGDIERVSLLERFPGLRTFATDEGLLRGNLVQVIVLPGATVEGRTIKESGFRSLFDAAVVGLRRGGQRLSGQLGRIRLQAGDSLMLATGADFYARRNVEKNFLVVGDRSVDRRLPPVVDTLIGVAMLLVIVGAAAGVIELLKGLAALLVAMLGLGVIRAGELRRRFPFEIGMIIVSALVLAEALAQSGLVNRAADLIHLSLADRSPVFALAGVYLGTLFLTELMTNNAAAALAFPVAYGLAESFGVSVFPFAMAVAYGASASFLTPYGYTTNLMVQNLGGYRFRDYLRFGFPVSLAYSTVVIVLLPRVFPLSPV
ncbi:MAG: SLC13 family permease, partial [Pseudomonadota bacterium]